MMGQQHVVSTMAAYGLILGTLGRPNKNVVGTLTETTSQSIAHNEILNTLKFPEIADFIYRVLSSAPQSDAAWIQQAAEPAYLFLGMLIAGGWALLPDIDHHNSTITRKIPLKLGVVISGFVRLISGGHRKGTHSLVPVLTLAVLGSLVSFSQWAVIALAIASTFLISRLILPAKAKKYTYFLVGGLIVVSMLLVKYAIEPTNTNSWWVILAISGGYLGHIVGDWLTVEKIQPFYPFSTFSHSLGLFHVGGKFETRFMRFVFYTLLVLVILLFLAQLPEVVYDSFVAFGVDLSSYGTHYV